MAPGNCLAFCAPGGKSQTHWEERLNGPYPRGLKGDKLLLIVTNGYPGLAEAIQYRLRARRPSTLLHPSAGYKRCETSWGRFASATTMP